MPAADGLFVLVGGRRVDQAVAGLDRVDDAPLALVEVGHLEDAEPEDPAPPGRCSKLPFACLLLFGLAVRTDATTTCHRLRYLRTSTTRFDRLHREYGLMGPAPRSLSLSQNTSLLTCWRETQRNPLASRLTWTAPQPWLCLLAFVPLRQGLMSPHTCGFSSAASPRVECFG